MGLTTYVFLLFGISVALYLAGFHGALFTMMNCSSTATSCTPQALGWGILGQIMTAIMSNPIMSIVGAAGLLITGYLLGGNFIVLYVVPIILLETVANFILLPTDFIFSQSFPPEISLIILGFMNILLLLTIITFIRGGD